MPSPFPGMDPYLERHWGDVHHRLITYASDQLNKRLPRDLRARVEERLVVETPEGERPIVPDVRILKRAISGIGTGRAAPAIATAEPYIVPLDEPLTEGYIEIRDKSADHRVVTVIEVLSPSNKTPGEARNQYLQKQQELWKGQISLVEIDLLRAGRRLLPFRIESLPPDCRTPYTVCVTRGWKLTEVEFYPMPLRAPLPTIRIPLRQTDPDAPLELQKLIEQCYENGSYTDDLDYKAEADPPLEGEDARWADALLRKQGQRARSRRNGKRSDASPKRR